MTSGDGEKFVGGTPNESQQSRHHQGNCSPTCTDPRVRGSTLSSRTQAEKPMNAADPAGSTIIPYLVASSRLQLLSFKDVTQYVIQKAAGAYNNCDTVLSGHLVGKVPRGVGCYRGLDAWAKIVQTRFYNDIVHWDQSSSVISQISWDDLGNMTQDDPRHPRTSHLAIPVLEIPEHPTWLYRALSWDDPAHNRTSHLAVLGKVPVLGLPGTSHWLYWAKSRVCPV
jgi:hypothetical protein